MAQAVFALASDVIQKITELKGKLKWSEVNGYKSLGMSLSVPIVVKDGKYQMPIIETTKLGPKKRNPKRYLIRVQNPDDQNQSLLIPLPKNITFDNLLTQKVNGIEQNMLMVDLYLWVADKDSVYKPPTKKGGEGKEYRISAGDSKLRAIPQNISYSSDLF